MPPRRNGSGEPARLAAYMNTIKCRAGITQIGRVLDHVLREAGQRKIGALVFVGDCAEESPSLLMPKARRLAELGTPAFMFLEGNDAEGEVVFREIAAITRGAFCRFNRDSAKQLGDLLRAAAVFATGGTAALARLDSNASKFLLGQLR